jgi:putative transposase
MLRFTLHRPGRHHLVSARCHGPSVRDVLGCVDVRVVAVPTADAEARSTRRCGGTVVWNLHVHVVFVTTYRPGVCDAAMLTRCERVMRQVCEDFGGDLRAFSGETATSPGRPLPTHPRTRCPARQLPSRAFHPSGSCREYPARSSGTTAAHVWAPSYFAASRGGPPLEIAKEHIRGQKRPDRAGASSPS